MRPAISLALLAVSPLLALPWSALHAQEAEPSAGALAESMLAARKAYAPVRAKRCGAKGEDGEIIVCAPDDGKQWRVPSSTTDDPLSAAALRTGVPRAPELGRGSCRGKFGCLTGGAAPDPVYMIDLSQIPPTPPGSEADMVASGEMSDR